MSALLNLEQVDAFYGSAHILHRLSLTVQPGERVALIGRNGVGKTTVVNTILGLASLRVKARPMPEAPPVTSAILFCIRMVDLSWYVGCGRGQPVSTRRTRTGGACLPFRQGAARGDPAMPEWCQRDRRDDEVVSCCFLVGR